MHWYLGVFKKYADFSGRARRMEYWMFNLFNIIILTVLFILMFAFVDGQTQQFTTMSAIFGIILVIYCLGTILPSIAVTVRRLHDTDRSGAWFFINFVPYIGGLVLLIFMCLNGTPGSNRFGEDPLASSNDNLM
ncbi:DUF805 domain-containing protein [Entomomonas moraniae]|uniref:DUF805 domain-containing protein n=1 Tax=Entomomonas moraniae TaxID=2213226 RepID=A0A3S9XB21_9GAMM|nr:DUF805 domain-containing protein [Entomomonas moraniae]AZS49622.1 DUF805 domain-containing protein [Entomomonas moraniae]